MLEIEGTVLGYSEKGYDFIDESGERRTGLTRLLHVLDGMSTVEVKVPEALATQAASYAQANENKKVRLRVKVSPKIRPALTDDAFALQAAKG